MGRDYFALKRVRVFMPLDLEAVERKFGDKPYKTEDPSWHPHIELTANPTVGALQLIGVEAGPEDFAEAIRMIAVVARKWGGDWTLYIASWGEESPEWPDLFEEGALAAREALVPRLQTVDATDTAATIHGLLSVSEAEEGESKAP